jgi:NADH dehydrogenase
MTNHVVILGAGYAGLQAALETRRMFTANAVRITIVNRQPFHQLVTELHQPAAGSVDDKHVRLPLDKLLAGKRIGICLNDVSAIHTDNQTVEFSDNTSLHYDVLVIALGSETEFFGIPGLKEHSFILKSVADANRIRNHVEDCFAQYKLTNDRAYLTVVVGGAGLTGIELVGEFADMMPQLCRKHDIDSTLVELLSIEAAPSILPGFPETLVERAKTSLQSRGVKFFTGMPIVQMEPGVAHLKNGDLIHTKTLIWTGGVRGHSVVASSGLAVEGRGRAFVNAHLQSVSNSHVFVLGDSALVLNEQGRPYPPTAQLAGQMGLHCGRQIYALLKGAKMDDFHPHFAGTLASLGRKDAIGMVGQRKREIKGKPASILKYGSKVRWLSEIGALFTRVE